jgi:hypothetical protein
MVDWHRLFGVALSDLFAGSPWVVELEKELSLKQQFLDVVIVRRGSGTFAGRLPDGLEELADHNLLTFKSLHEPLDDWALKELTGHYVNYRKQLGGAVLLGEEAFRLYGVCSRFPQKLAEQLGLERQRDGIYAVQRGTDRITVVVLSEIPRAEHNTVWHLFSGVPDTVRYGAEHLRLAETSSIFNQLFQLYRLEGVSMPYTMEDFKRDVARDNLERMTPEERLEILKGLSPEERLKGLPPEERLKGLPPEELLKVLPVDLIEAYLKRLKGDQTTPGRSQPKNGSQ